MNNKLKATLAVLFGIFILLYQLFKLLPWLIVATSNVLIPLLFFVGLLLYIYGLVKLYKYIAQ